MRSSARSRDDGDVIRARLRALLAEGQPTSGWVPEDGDEHLRRGHPDDDPDDEPDGEDDEPDGEDDAPTERVYPTDDVALPAGLGRHRAAGRTARLDPGRPGAWAMWVVAVLAAAAVLGWTWLDRPAVEPVGEEPSTAAGSAQVPPAASSSPPVGEPVEQAVTVVVSVVGQVTAPGLVTLPAGSRVADALAAAGGLLPEADPASVNAAAVVSDGQQIAVGVPGAAGAGADAGAGAAASGAASGGPVDLNTATPADLDALPGIGPVLAQRIVDHRTAHGRFTSVDQLDDVSGIGPTIFADLAERVRV